MPQNNLYVSINTDKAISDILGNFSDDYIMNLIEESLNYRIRPFNTRMPNTVSIIEENFNNILAHSVGGDPSVIMHKRSETYQNIIDTICRFYNLEVVEEIPENQEYAVAYILFQIFVSEYFERMIGFYLKFMMTNSQSIVAALNNREEGLIRTKYAKKMYGDDPKMAQYITLYDNMDKVIDIIAGMDINLPTLISGIADVQSSNLICTYISDTGDIFRYHYASLLNSIVRTDILTTLKLELANNTVSNTMMTNPEENPYVMRD